MAKTSVIAAITGGVISGMIGTLAMTNVVIMATGPIAFGITTANTSAIGAIINASAAGYSFRRLEASLGLKTC